MKFFLLFFISFLFCTTLGAENFDWLRINGFGSFGASTNTCQGCETNVISDQPDGTREGQLEFGNHFYFGVQADAAIHEYIRGSVQILSRKNIHSNYSPDVEWLYLAASPKEDLSIRGGRLRAPIYLMSESMHVGFSRPFINPPHELYSMFSVSSYEGADILYRHYLDEFTFDFQVAAGESSPLLLTGEEPSFSNVSGIYAANASAMHENFRIRLSYLVGHVSVSTPELESLFSSLRVSGFSDVAEDLEENNKRGNFLGFGIEYIDEELFVQAEWGSRQTEGFLTNDSAWYIASGLFLDEYTPYVIYSVRKNDETYKNPLPSDSPLYDAVETLANPDFSQTTYSLGMRYDIRENVDIKFQYDRIHPSENGLFIRTDESFESKPTDQITAVIDYVF